MRKKIVYLTLLLLVQLGLALVLQLNSNQLKAFDATEKLLKLDQQVPDRLVFEGADNAQLVLAKKGDHWTLPDHFSARADGQKVEDLIKSLGELRRPWPVAEKGTADSRFKVADDNFERRLTLKQGDKELARLLLGSSPGFRKVHARVAGEHKVYDIPFSAYQASLKPEDWVDKQQLQLKPEQIKEIGLADCRLVRQDSRLLVTDLTEGEKTVEKKAAELVDKLARLTILDQLPHPDQSLAAGEGPRIELSLSDGSQRSYQITGEKGDELEVSGTGEPQLFKVNPNLKAELAAFNRQLLVEPGADGKTDEGSVPAKK
jgi:hypothetical protein